MRCTVEYADVDDFKRKLNSAEPKLRAKVLMGLKLIETYGLDAVDIDLLKDGLFEIRTRHSNNIFRVVFFYDPNTKACIVITNGFVKKDQRTPTREIDKAKRLRKIYFKGRETL